MDNRKSIKRPSAVSFSETATIGGNNVLKVVTSVTAAAGQATLPIDITKLAMDGLMVRQKAITANIANVMTPDYQRKDVKFED